MIGFIGVCLLFLLISASLLIVSWHVFSAACTKAGKINVLSEKLAAYEEKELNVKEQFECGVDNGV